MLTTELGAELRQGDVCSVPGFPRWTTSSIKIDTVNPAQLMVEAWDRPLKSGDGGCFVAVCSYDCDFVNPRERAGVLLAPVMPLPASPGSQREADILASDVVRDGKIGYVNLFPLLLQGEFERPEAVVDFSSMATLFPTIDALAALTATRFFTMTSDMRIAFKEKLSLFLRRPGEDD